MAQTVEEQGQETQTDLLDIPSDLKKKFNAFLKKAKNHYDLYHIEKALKLYERARDIVATPQVVKRIERLQALLSTRNELPNGYIQDDTASLYILDDVFFLGKSVYDGLLTHQREGVRWFWDLYKNGHGGILGDDMVSCIALSHHTHTLTHLSHFLSVSASISHLSVFLVQ